MCSRADRFFPAPLGSREDQGCGAFLCLFAVNFLIRSRCEVFG